MSWLQAEEPRCEMQTEQQARDVELSLLPGFQPTRGLTDAAPRHEGKPQPDNDRSCSPASHVSVPFRGRRACRPGGSRPRLGPDRGVSRCAARSPYQQFSWRVLLKSVQDAVCARVRFFSAAT